MKTQVINHLGATFNKVVFKVKKHSPEILIATGVIGMVATTVLACKATTKISSIIEKAKESIDTIHDCAGNENLPQEYTLEDGKKDLVIVYAQTGFKIAKIYAPAITVGIFSLTCILSSHNILKKRNVALSAAYAAIDNGFKTYRNRVIERFGENVDREIRCNIKAKEIEETVIDKKGNEKKVPKTIYCADPNGVSDYARYFDKYTTDEKGNSVMNTYWEDNGEYNLMFLKSIQRFANDKLKAKGHLFLNEVYEMLSFPPTKAGQIVGWVYDADNSRGDNYIDFGIYSAADNFSDFVNHNDSILLDFNVDGNIWDLM